MFKNLGPAAIEASKFIGRVAGGTTVAVATVKVLEWAGNRYERWSDARKAKQAQGPTAAAA